MISLENFSFLPYEKAAFRGGIESDRLFVLEGVWPQLAEPLDAVILSSDLQGCEPPQGEAPRRMLGVTLVQQLLLWSSEGRLPPPERTGIVLGGDVYADTELSRRGLSGDASAVWDAFAAHYRWITGVLGNHDTLYGRERLENLGNVHILDGTKVELDGLKIGGISGIMGKTTKLNRKEPKVYMDELRQLAKWGPDLLVLHQGPSVREKKLIGSDDIRKILDETRPPLVASGHCHWKRAVVELSGRTTLLNTDARVIVLRRDASNQGA